MQNLFNPKVAIRYCSIVLLLNVFSGSVFSENYTLYRIRRGLHHSLVLTPHPFKILTAPKIQGDTPDYVWIGFGSWRWMLEERKDFVEAFRSILFPQKGIIVMYDLALPKDRIVETLKEMSETDKTEVDEIPLTQKAYTQIKAFILKECQGEQTGSPLILKKGISFLSQRYFFGLSNCQSFCQEVINIAKDSGS